MNYLLWLAIAVLAAKVWSLASEVKHLKQDAIAESLRPDSLSESIEFLRANQLKLRQDLDAMRPKPSEVQELDAKCRLTSLSLYPRRPDEK